MDPRESSGLAGEEQNTKEFCLFICEVTVPLAARSTA